MSQLNPAPVPVDRPSPLGEVRYPLKQMLIDAEQDRMHFALGGNMLDQSEIASVLARRRKPAKAKRAEQLPPSGVNLIPTADPRRIWGGSGASAKAVK